MGRREGFLEKEWPVVATLAVSSIGARLVW